jgi:hypothetical protein
MNEPASISITPVHLADLLVEGELMPVYVHVIPEAVSLAHAHEPWRPQTA